MLVQEWCLAIVQCFGQKINKHKSKIDKNKSNKRKLAISSVLNKIQYIIHLTVDYIGEINKMCLESMNAIQFFV